MRHVTKYVSWAIAAAALVALAVVLVLVNLPEKRAKAAGTEVGEVLPDFTAECLGGSIFRLEEQRGKVVVINIWATWCAPCVKELPNFHHLQEEYGDNVVVLALHAAPITADVPSYLSNYSYNILFALDEQGELGNALNMSTVLPQTIIIAPDGTVAYNQPGALSYEKLVEIVEAAN